MSDATGSICVGPYIAVAAGSVNEVERQAHSHTLASKRIVSICFMVFSRVYRILTKRCGSHLSKLTTQLRSRCLSL